MKFWRQHKDEELDAEIRSHLDELIPASSTHLGPKKRKPSLIFRTQKGKAFVRQNEACIRHPTDITARD